MKDRTEGWYWVLIIQVMSGIQRSGREPLVLVRSEKA